MTSRRRPAASRTARPRRPRPRRRTSAIGADQNRALRSHLTRLLDWEDAHVSFDAAVAGIPPALRGVAPRDVPYSPWQLLEHLRLCQSDILEFCRNRRYVEPSPEEYWPRRAAPPSPSAWDHSVAGFRKDREVLKRLAMNPALNLFDRIPHGTGQTYLRELLLVADHNTYHVAQLVVVRRCLGLWNRA